MNVEEKFFSDVKTSVGNGDSYMHENHTIHDKHKRWKRYLGRNVDKIAGNAIKTIVAGVLTGGVGAGIAVGVMVSKTTIIHVYRRNKKNDAKKTISGHAGGLTISSASMNSVWLDEDQISNKEGSGKSIKIVDETYTEILDEMSYLIEHGQLTETMEAFDALEADAKALEAITRSGIYTTCEDCWHIAEHVERISMRIKGLEEAIALIQDYVEYSVLLTSKHDDGFELRSRQIEGWIIKKAGSKDAAQKILDKAAKALGIFGNVLFDATVDYSAALPINALADMASSFEGMFTEGSKGVMKGAIAAGAAEGISSGIGIGVDLTIALINNYVARRAYTSVKDKITELNKSPKQLVQILSEFDGGHISALRRAAKDVIEKCTTKLKHLGEAQLVVDGMTELTSPEKLAEGLLIRQKYRKQFDELSQALYLFQEITVGRVIAIEIAAGKIKTAEYPKMGIFISTGHKIDQACLEGLCCYKSSAGMLDKTVAIFVDINVPNIANRWDDVPFRPITNDGLFHKVWEKWAI